MIQTIHNSSHTNVQTPQDDASLSDSSNIEKLSYLCFKWDFCVQVRSEIVWWKETIMAHRQRSRSMFCVLRPGHRKWPPRRYIFTKGDTCNRPPAPADQISRQNFFYQEFWSLNPFRDDQDISVLSFWVDVGGEGGV